MSNLFPIDLQYMITLDETAKRMYRELKAHISALQLGEFQTYYSGQRIVLMLRTKRYGSVDGRLRPEEFQALVNKSGGTMGGMLALVETRLDLMERGLPIAAQSLSGFDLKPNPATDLAR